MRLSATALPPDQLLVNNAAARDTTLGLWRFEEQPGFASDESGHDNHLQPTLPSASSTKRLDPHAAARIDFCHVLLNSNEFLYVE